MFKDPASVYCYSLILVHHQVMWYMIIILGVVYWNFYKIIDEYKWNNKKIINQKMAEINLIFFEIKMIIGKFIFEYVIQYAKIWIKFYLEKNHKRYGYHGWANLAISLQIILNNDDFDILPVDEFFEIGAEDYLIEKYIEPNTTKAYRNVEDILEIEKFRENLLLEYIWAIFPSLVIILILIPSLYLLYSLEENMDPKFTMKVIGHQWFWSYEFHNEGLGINYQYESNLIPEQDLENGAKRLLEVDNKFYLPVNVPVRILVTSSDVLHSWAVPELGIKVDAVPGRLNDCITLIRRPGIFYGQCSELCGVGHGFMPIAVEASSYKNWIEKISKI